MNIIGLIAPKIVSLLMILVPDYETKYKLVLIFFWIVKLVIDYDTVKPGHSGNIYKLIKRVRYEVSELIVACIQFLPAVVYLVSAVVMETWIPAIPGAVAAIAGFAKILWCIKDVIAEKKRQ